MKKIIVTLLVAVLALSAVALAETYKSDDLSFKYDADAFDVEVDDRTDDETTVVLTGKDAAWGQTYVRFYLKELEKGETFPTPAEFKPIADVEVTQGDWNGFKDVFMYTVENDDGTSQHFFVAPVADDDDGEIEDLLTVEIGTTAIDDADAAARRDDLISAVVDSLVVDD
ncbi:MAG: hypothetical protein IJ646_02315 [Clostridia bacterium]|nr:hypothetical protein [Clostridia bacterium]